MKIYTAGPITGLTYEEVVGEYRSKIEILSSYGYDVITPMAGKQDLVLEECFKAVGYGKLTPVATSKAIKQRDRWMVGQSDIILADLRTGIDKVSIGTCMELAWGDELKKHTVTVMTKDNIHNHAFVLQCSSIVLETIEEAYAYLEQLNRKTL